MFTREQSEHTRSEAKNHLKNYGWSYRAAGPALEVTYQHLCEVLNGKRTSRRLIEKIFKLKRATPK